MLKAREEEGAHNGGNIDRKDAFSLVGTRLKKVFPLAIGVAIGTTIVRGLSMLHFPYEIVVTNYPYEINVEFHPITWEVAFQRLAPHFIVGFVGTLLLGLLFEWVGDKISKFMNED